MKKLSIIMATVVSLVCLLCVSASAANEVTVSGAVTEAAGGSEFTYTVSFSENTGFNTLGVKLTYPEGFEYVEAEASDLIKEAFYLDFAGYSGETYVFHHDEDARTITFVGASLYNVENASGTLFDITFTAPEAAGAYDFTLELVDNAYNEDGKVVAVDKVNGKVTVEEGSTYALGNVTMDFNEDGTDKINYMDAVRVLQISSGIIENPSELELYLANVTNDYDDEGNPIVNYMDAVKILQHAAGLIEIQ